MIEVIDDIDFLENRRDELIGGEFREFLAGDGCAAATIVHAGD